MKILLVNSDQTLTRKINDFFCLLHQMHINVYLHHRNLGKLSSFEFNIYDAVIISIVLPYQSGLVLCHDIRQIDQKIPIILIADCEKIQQSGLADQLNLAHENLLSQLGIMGIENGADDVVANTIPPSELLARVNNVIRRCAYNQHQKKSDLQTIDKEYTFRLQSDKVIHFSLSQMTLTSSFGLETKLTTSDSELLCVFLNHPRKLLTRDYLINQIKMRDYQGSSDRFIDVRIGMLRKKLLDYQHQFIMTMRGKGYVFNADVLEIETE